MYVRWSDGASRIYGERTYIPLSRCQVCQRLFLRREETEVGRIYTRPPDERSWDVRVESGADLLTTMKALRAVFGRDLREAKAVATSLPAVLLRGVSWFEAEAAQSKLIEQGVRASVVTDEPEPPVQAVPQAWHDAAIAEDVTFHDCMEALERGLIDNTRVELQVRRHAWHLSLPPRSPPATVCTWVPWEERPLALANAERLAELDTPAEHPLHRAELRRQLGRTEQAVALYELALLNTATYDHPRILGLLERAQSGDVDRAPLIMEAGMFTVAFGFRP